MNLCPNGHPKTPENVYADGRCRPCTRSSQKQYYQNNKKAFVDRASGWKKKNPANTRAVNKRWRENNSTKVRDSYLRRTYGISLADYDALFAAQGGGCAVCGDAPEPLHVDHCHRTGKVRGLLCSPCNKALGHLNDNPKLLRRAAEYVEKNQ